MLTPVTQPFTFTINQSVLCTSWSHTLGHPSLRWSFKMLSWSPSEKVLWALVARDSVLGALWFTLHFPWPQLSVNRVDSLYWGQESGPKFGSVTLSQACPSEGPWGPSSVKRAWVNHPGGASWGHSIWRVAKAPVQVGHTQWWETPIHTRHLTLSSCNMCFIWKEIAFRGGLPGDSVVKNPPTSAGDIDSIPGHGRSHMPWSNSARVPQLLSPSSEAKKPQLLKP